MTATIGFVEGKLRVAMQVRGLTVTCRDYVLLTAGFLLVDGNARSGAMPRPETFLSYRVLPSPLNPYQNVVHRDVRFPWTTKDLQTAISVTIHGPFRGPFLFDLPADPDSVPPTHGLEHLAKTDPAALVALLVADGTEPWRLTFAAEIAGRELPGELVIEPLLALLGHERGIVREGAVYGLARFLSDARVRKAVEALLRDPSPGVRAAAADELDAYDETLS